MIPSLFKMVLETDTRVRPQERRACWARGWAASLQRLRPPPGFPASGVHHGALDVRLDQAGLRADGVGRREPLPGSSQSGAAYLDVVTLEEVQVGFALTRVPADQSQEGVEDAGVHHGLAQLHAAHGEALQLLLRSTGAPGEPAGAAGAAHLHLRRTWLSGSRRLTLFSSTCSTISCVHTFPLASSRRSRLTPSSTVTIPSFRSNTKVVRCCSGSEPTRFLTTASTRQHCSAAARPDANANAGCVICCVDCC